MVVQDRSYTSEEFLEIAQLPEYADLQLELLNGELLIMPPSSPLNSETAGIIIYLLNAFVIPNKLGRVTVPDGGYKLGPNTTLVPEVAFTAHSRKLDFSGSVVHGAPDLAVEVVSPSESNRKVIDKARAFLNAGTKVVWAVYPKDKVVDVYRINAEGQVTILTAGMDDELAPDDILPGFTISVKDIFPEETE